jgi:hypothetical protein
VGLQSSVTSGVVLKILALLDNTRDLPDLSTVGEFWTLDVGRLNNDPGPGWPEHELWNWYKLLTGLNGVSGALASKIVHHKYPTVMPLWDSYIGQAYHLGARWGAVCLDLQRNDDWFEALEVCFENHRLTYECDRDVALKRLRLIDILIWSHVCGIRERVGNRGRALLLVSSDSLKYLSPPD